MEKKNAHKILVGEPEEDKACLRPGNRGKSVEY
jgi:hypothetical protein